MRRHARKPSRRLLMALTLVFALAFAAMAVGYWSATGSGTATTRLPDQLALTLSPATPDDPIAPGGVADVSVVVSNPNPFQVHMGSFVLDDDEGAQFSVDLAHNGCDVSALTFTAQTNAGAGWDIPPKVGSQDGTLVVQLRDALAMSNAAANACQGATFAITLDARS